MAASTPCAAPPATATATPPKGNLRGVLPRWAALPSTTLPPLRTRPLPPVLPVLPCRAGSLRVPAADGGAVDTESAFPASSSWGPSSSLEDYPGSSGSTKKRFRTMFTQEQKDRMIVFAERFGWRTQKHDDPTVEQFCVVNGIRRHVLKVWMHNNKHTLGKKP
ncbi:hypothetical protein MLD38_034534 [Melastoma candidum]|uniref:Uncharacterized protein n=1 Tax=Melastoma candidum TaxID=119954 RepID=A0ACB9MCS4_9MYRT|nr:hypothetical protein MLD38_034534 [Melastoma candidum]